MRANRHGLYAGCPRSEIGSKTRVDFQTLDRLLNYFRGVLEQTVTMADLLEYVSDEEVK